MGETVRGTARTGAKKCPGLLAVSCGDQYNEKHEFHMAGTQVLQSNVAAEQNEANLK